ncbi:lipocalin family protein [Spirosoma sp. SC4-14]|uniref:lipocalin family protein n=1 Tax=Spirosoma sp. SC4-14 TaxID=3128900 RepID=UPI0030D429E3
MMKLGRLFTWALVIAMPLWFGSCKKESGGSGDPVTPNSIEGSWKISGMKLKQGNQTEDYLDLIKQYVGEDAVACLTDSKITFNSNGKVTGVASPKCQSAGADDFNPATDNSTWNVSGSKLTITDSDGAQVYDLAINGNSMTWSVNEQDDLDGDGVKETYTTMIEFKRA